MEDFTNSMRYGDRLGDFSMDMVGLEMVINEENNWGFKD